MRSMTRSKGLGSTMQGIVSWVCQVLVDRLPNVERSESDKCERESNLESVMFGVNNVNRGQKGGRTKTELEYEKDRN